MPAPDGPVCVALAAPEELVTAADGAVVPVDKSVVVVEDEAALVDELVPEVLVDETASWARVDDCESINKSRATMRRNMRGSVNFIFLVFLISRSTKHRPKVHHFLTYNTPAKADRHFWQTSMSGAA